MDITSTGAFSVGFWERCEHYCQATLEMGGVQAVQRSAVSIS
jgi:hypothetical protein